MQLLSNRVIRPFLWQFNQKREGHANKVGLSCFLLSLYLRILPYAMFLLSCRFFLRQQDFVNSWHPANLKFLETKLNSFWWFFDIWLKKVFRKHWTFSRKISSKKFFATTDFRYYSCPTDYENFFQKQFICCEKTLSKFWKC